MDPKSLSHLDPKLRETYERVMGTAAAVHASNENTQASPVKADESVDEPGLSKPIEESHETSATFSSSPTNISAAEIGIEQSPNTNKVEESQPVSPTPYHVVETPPDTQLNISADNSGQPAMQPLPSPASVAQIEKNANAGPLLRILYIVGAVIFFIIYTIFWIKVFNLPFFF